MQGNRGFPAAGHSLNHQELMICIANNTVLLLLYGVYNIPHLFIGVPAQYILEYFIINFYAGIQHKLQSVPIDPELALQAYRALYYTFRANIMGPPQLKIIVNT